VDAVLASPRPVRLLALAGVFAAALVVAAVLLLSGGGAEHSPGAKTIVDKPHRFVLSYPASGWRAAPPLQGTAAILERADHRATVVVRERPALRQSLVQIGRGLTPELKRRFRDFRPLSARIVRLAARPALAYTFARTRTGTVQTELVVPARGRSYTVEAVARANDAEAARQVGAILRSFVAR
jgi:hypothetical protein